MYKFTSIVVGSIGGLFIQLIMAKYRDIHLDQYLAHVRACCLAAPGYYLSQYWLNFEGIT